MDDRKNGSDKFIVDIAAEHRYFGQNEKYHRRFAKWRNDPKNPYGYRFVHDVREHVYVDGGGYADVNIETAERHALKRCFSFLGISMLVLFAILQLQSLFTTFLLDRRTFEWSYLSKSTGEYVVGAKEMLMICGFQTLGFAIIILLYIFFLRLPPGVAFTTQRVRPSFFVYCLVTALFMCVIFHRMDMLAGLGMHRLGIETSFFSVDFADSELSEGLYYFFEVLIFPLLYELVFRGCVLQLFRQFGDSFAIFISAIASSLCYSDVTKIIFYFCWGLLFGAIAVKGGNVFVAAAVRACCQLFGMIINSIWLGGDLLGSRLMISIVCLSVMVICFTVFVVIRKKKPIPLAPEETGTSLSFETKLHGILGSPMAVIWLILSLLHVIVSVELL